MRCFVRCLLVLALSLSIGLQWVVVQGAAWVGMVVSHSKETTISQSLARTFGGNHPCKLCRAAQRGESTQKKQDADNIPLKFVLAAPGSDEFFIEPPVPSEIAFSAGADDGRLTRPPVPPPRSI